MEKPYKIVNNQRVFDFKKTLRYIQFLGKSKYGEEFKIHRSDVVTHHPLIIYMIHEHRQCKKYNIDLNKVILLIRPIGSGKTSIMKLLRVFLFKEQLYNIKSSRDIALEYLRKGVEIMHRDGKRRTPLFIDYL